MIDFVGKTREEQEIDFLEIKEYANPNCKKCYGTAKEYWVTELNQYKVCDCVIKNIRTLQELNERKN